MSSFFGCLFMLIFGVVFFIIGVGMKIANALFGTPNRTAWGNADERQTRTSSSYGERSSSSYNTSSGNAHHESRPNSRQRRSNKIFERNEGEYVDFEDVPNS